MNFYFILQSECIKGANVIFHLKIAIIVWLLPIA